MISLRPSDNLLMTPGKHITPFDNHELSFLPDNLQLKPSEKKGEFQQTFDLLNPFFFFFVKLDKITINVISWKHPKLLRNNTNENI